MARKSPQASDSERVFRLGGKEVQLTHLDRLYYPQAGLTKGDILDYYLTVSPYLLPHLRGRPLTLERWPEGVEDGSFFQKDASPYFPPWLRTFPVERKDHQKVVHYPLADDAADLLYLVNLGTLTFHTQMARIDDPEHPDIMVLDVDPPEVPPEAPPATPQEPPPGARSEKRPEARNPALPGPSSGAGGSTLTPFQRAAEVAFLLREALKQAGFDPLVKTSGKRGVHLAFPLTGDLDYSQARVQLKELFASLVKRHPRLLTTDIRKAKRGGRVYLDALRMSPGATIVPPYVTRPTPEATVSTPVTWEELAHLQDGLAFTVLTVPARLAWTGDLWAPLTRGAEGSASVAATASSTKEAP